MKKPLSQRISERRKELGWTQEYLAKITGYSRVYIAEIERGKYKNPGLESAKKIFYALGLKEIRLDEL